MKYMRLALLGLGLLFAVSATQAQQAGVKADIPFSFVVGNQVLPAGEYLVKPSDGAQAVWIRSDEHKSAMVSIAHKCASVTPSATTKMVFRTVGGQYFLSQIWTQGYAQGRELPQSKLERQMAKNQPEGQFVLAANLTN